MAVEKKRKKRVKPPTPLHEEAVAEADCAKRDIDTATRRRLAAEGKALPNLSYPIENVEDLGNAAHLARTGHGDVAAARRLIARRAKELGVANPLESSEKATGNPVDMPGGRSAFDRVSPPISAGHAAYSTGDHGAASGSGDPMDVAGPKRVALGHPSMRQGTTSIQPLLSAVVAGSSTEHAGEHNIVGLYSDARVQVSLLDAAAAAGMSGPSGNPAMRNLPHTAPIGASNGSHSLSNPLSNAPMAMKSMTPLEAVRRFQRRV